MNIDPVPPPCRMTMRRRAVISALDARKPRSARQRARPLRGRHPVGLHDLLRSLFRRLMEFSEYFAIEMLCFSRAERA